MFSIPEEIIKKYSVSGPRYTSYPTVPNWKAVTRDEQLSWYSKTAEISNRQLGLYIHVPFCKSRCFYCGCNVIVSRNEDRKRSYVLSLLAEIERLGKLFKGSRKLALLHFGGGTPTTLSNEEFSMIISKIKSYFEFDPQIEISIEVDARVTKPETLDYLSELGVNRMSLGVQDIDPKVQKAVNRIQPVELTAALLEKARKLNFTGINFDLIYGLPHQSIESFQHTIDQVIQMRPDRLAVYNFAYLPDQNPNQKGIRELDLPSGETKLDILFNTIRSFNSAGYEYIGMDHFATQEDELTKAQKDRRLYRNFMGYTPKSGIDQFGIGLSSIGEFGPYFVQNEKALDQYQSSIVDNGLAGVRGIELTDDDLRRKWVIMQLICNFFLSYREFEKEFRESFVDLYSHEISKLREIEDDGLIELLPDGIKVTDNGKILVRNICMIFDTYLKSKAAGKTQFSKTI